MEKEISGRFSKVEIGDELQDTALDLREEYIHYIGKLSETSCDISWYWTSLSEKNPFISDAFLNFCYLKASTQIIKKGQGNFFIICESRAVMECIRMTLASDTSLEIRLYDSAITKLSFSLREVCLTLKSHGVFVLRFSLRAVLARIFAFFSYRRRSTLKLSRATSIHSLIDKRTFKNPSRYEDIFLGDLGAQLEDRNQNIVYICNILPTFFYPLAVTILFKRKEKCILADEFLTPVDPLVALYTVHHLYPGIPSAPRFSDMDVSPIIREEIQNDLHGVHSAHAYLHYLMGMRMSERFDFSVFIYHFENNMWEKMICAGIRQHSPNCRIIGHQHTSINIMDTNYYVSGFEKSSMPLPDLIVTIGNRARNVLIHGGFDPNRVVIGGALRYPALLENQQSCPETLHKKILIATTDDVNASLELIIKCIHAFRDYKNHTIIVKFHPTLPVRYVLPHLNDIPGNFVIRTDPVDVLLPECGLVIYTATSVSVEALARGIPILHIRSDMVIDRDIYEKEDNIASASKPDDILKAAEDLLGKQRENQSTTSTLIGEMFSPVSEESYQLFQK
ncbi:MAG: hypothetical protein ACYDDV_03580 [Methanoregula sp.]